MICSACGSEVPEGGLFCPKCGNRVAGVAPPPPPLPPTSYSYSGAAAVDLMKRPAVITILSILNLGGGALLLMGGLAILIFAPKSNSDDLIFASIAGGILVLFGLLYLVTGRGLWTLSPYARVMQIVFSCIGLLAFPLGSIISILILVYLFKPEVKLLFSGRTETQLSSAETQMLTAFAHGGAGGAAMAIAIVAVLFVGVAMMGIISAIAIPNLLNAIQRGKQKRTMADIRAIGTACETYAVDYNVYPEVDSLDQLATVLEPKYIRSMPRRDAWEQSFHYDSWSFEGEDTEGPAHYLIVSSGKDGLLEHEDLDGYEVLATQSFNNDIAFSDGEFIEYPEGAQN